jgi:hypothetical protein
LITDVLTGVVGTLVAGAEEDALPPPPEDAVPPEETVILDDPLLSYPSVARIW